MSTTDSVTPVTTPDDQTPPLDMDRVGRFAQQVGAMLAGGATAAMMAVGDRLGLYAHLATAGPVTSTQLAQDTGTAERYVREWLAQQAAVGFVRYDADSASFFLPPEHAAVLASDDSPAAMIGAAPLISGLHRRTEQLAEAFRYGHGISWADQDPAVLESTERFFGVGYRNSLVSEWIPAVEGLEEKLQAGCTVVDVGCGHGVPLILMAQAYPDSRFVGYDAHQPSIEVSTQRAIAAGVADRVRFEVGFDQNYRDEAVDLITFFDSFHDLGDPVGAAAHARGALAADGSLLLVEAFAGDDLAATLTTTPLAPIGYAASTFLCTSNSLSQPVGTALGALAGEQRLREVLTEAGFDTIRRVADSDLNMVIEAKRGSDHA